MMIECDSCAGTGFDGGATEGEHCIECEGIGEVDVCESCEGTGVVENGSGSRFPCGECDHDPFE